MNIGLPVALGLLGGDPEHTSARLHKNDLLAAARADGLDRRIFGA